MHGTPARWDSWAQWAGIIVMVAASLWHVSSDLATIKQSLADMAQAQQEVRQRLDRLEQEHFDIQKRGLN